MRWSELLVWWSGSGPARLHCNAKSGNEWENSLSVWVNEYLKWRVSYFIYDKWLKPYPWDSIAYVSELSIKLNSRKCVVGWNLMPLTRVKSHMLRMHFQLILGNGYFTMDIVCDIELLPPSHNKILIIFNIPYYHSLICTFRYYNQIISFVLLISSYTNVNSVHYKEDYLWSYYEYDSSLGGNSLMWNFH